VLLAAGAAARDEVRAAARARGIAAGDVMVAPRPANPFFGDVVVATRDEYYTGRFDWLAARGAAFELAAQAPAARRFLAWARYPAVDVEQSPNGSTRVRFADVRYRASGRLTGPVVELPAGALGTPSD
jgi:hypothetical protein